MSNKVKQFDIDEEGDKKREMRKENGKSGCFVTTTTGIIIALILIVIFVGKVFLIFFLKTNKPKGY